jgi:hypothetical protein
LPELITRIGAREFAGCSTLKEIVIVESVNYIGENAFADCTMNVYCKYPYLYEEWEPHCFDGLNGEVVYGY